MLDFNVEFSIGDKVKISKGDCIQTYSNDSSFVYLFTKKSKQEYVEYYVHDIEVVFSVKEGYKSCKFLLSTESNKLKASSSGWVSGSQIIRIDNID